MPLSFRHAFFTGVPILEITVDGDISATKITLLTIMLKRTQSVKKRNYNCAVKFLKRSQRSYVIGKLREKLSPYSAILNDSKEIERIKKDQSMPISSRHPRCNLMPILEIRVDRDIGTKDYITI